MNNASSKQNIWAAHIKAWKKSGNSRARYCRQRNISYHAFKYWEKKLKTPTSSPGTAIVPFSPEKLKQVCTAGSRETSLKIELGTRFKIEVPDGFAPSTLSLLISTLENC